MGLSNSPLPSLQLYPLLLFPKPLLTWPEMPCFSFPWLAPVISGHWV